MPCLTAWGHRAVQILQCTASLRGGSRQCNSCNAPPQCLGVVSSGTSAMRCLTALGHCLVERMQCTASRPMGSGRFDFSNALRH